jgi:CubicO group peptidase (beta-lactamase class C family)
VYGDVIGHTGGQTGCSAMFMLLPEERTTIAVLSNTSGAMREVSNIAVQLFDIAAAAGR